MVFDDDRLPLRRVEKPEVGLGGVSRRLSVDVRIDDGHRRIDADRPLRVDDLEGPLRFVDFEMGLVFERQVDVADFLLGEGGGGRPGAGVEDGSAPVEPFDVAPRVVGRAPGGQN